MRLLYILIILAISQADGMPIPVVTPTNCTSIQEMDKCLSSCDCCWCLDEKELCLDISNKKTCGSEVEFNNACNVTDTVLLIIMFVLLGFDCIGIMALCIYRFC